VFVAELGLVELKARVFEANVPTHWTGIRGLDAMRNVWHQIRFGRYLFEEGLCKTTLFQLSIDDHL
jgi:hypothetical protein